VRFWSPVRFFARPSSRPLAAALLLGAALALAPAVAPPGTVHAEEAAAPSAAVLLFETPQLGQAAPGSTLTYRYSRKVSDPELGASFEDRIKLLIAAPAAAAPKEARNVKVDFFGPERHRAAGPFEDVTGNPVLVLFLENHLAELSGKLMGNPRYFKNAIRTALRDKAEVAPADIDVGGRSFKGWRVTVTPFAGDANAKRMRGLEKLTYVFEVAPDLPGEIARITITADAKDGRLWEEALSYDPQGT